MNQINYKITEVLSNIVEEKNTTISFEDTWSKQEGFFSNIFERKALVAIVIAVFVLLPISGFAYYKLIWGNTNIKVSDEKINLSSMVTPIEYFDKLLYKDGVKLKNLEESRKIARFPIRIVNEVPGWRRIQSVGVIDLVQTRDSIGNLTFKDGDLHYMDLYTNDKGEKIVVNQRYDEAFTTSINDSTIQGSGAQYPYGTKTLEGYGKDLAVLIDIEKGRYNLIVHHKENNNQVTTLEIWGNTSPKVLEQFAHTYLKIEVE